jgi:hypothetical protein
MRKNGKHKNKENNKKSVPRTYVQKHCFATELDRSIRTEGEEDLQKKGESEEKRGEILQRTARNSISSKLESI